MPVGDDDPRTPLFFLSYAHATKGQGRLVRFFNELSENVAELVSRKAGSDPGYMDRSMEVGNRWAGNLLEAIGTCQVFVALLSGPYFESTWCSMEWFAFSQRPVTRRLDAAVSHQTAFVPVVWAAPLPSGLTPTAVKEVQQFSPNALPDVDLAGLYREHGVVGLRQMQVRLYRAVVWQIAQRIADIYYTYRVEPHVLGQHELRDVFQERRT